MSLRNDVWFVTSLIGSAIRQILGETFRTLADYLLREFKEVPPPEPPKGEIAPVRQKRSHKSKREAIDQEPPPEVVVKAPKPRDRSKYNPKDHGPYKISAIGILKTLLGRESGLSVPALAKIHTTSTDSSIRTACKTMVEDGILATEYSGKVNSNIYWIKDQNAAQTHLAELEASAPTLPTSEESREPEASLN